MFRPDRNVAASACEIHGYFDLTGAWRSTHVHFAVCILRRLQEPTISVRQCIEVMVISEQFARSARLSHWCQFGDMASVQILNREGLISEQKAHILDTDGTSEANHL